MQVVILCGGMGTRIRDVAEDLPKPMIPIGGRPILWHIMSCYARQGFKRFVICLGHKGWLIKRYFLDYNLAEADLTVRLDDSRPPQVLRPGPAADWEVTLVETGQHTMTGGRVKRAAPYLTGDHFLLTYGDGLSDVNLQRLVAFHLRQGRLGTVTAVRQPGRFGELRLAGARVVDFSEKPARAPGQINGGFFAFQRRFLDLLSDDEGLVLEQGPLTELARDGELAAYPHDGFWQCMDNSRDYQHLNQLWAQGNAPWAAPAQDARAAA